MGQKVHPIGFRVGITKKYQSQWFARFNKYSYAQSVLEDRMLRNTLLKIFPELLNPITKKGGDSVKKQEFSDRENSTGPCITQIKIERALIPYVIGIQIYAQNSELIKSAIDNLKINADLFCHLQKTRQFLLKLKEQVNLETSSKDGKLPSLKANFNNKKKDSNFVPLDDAVLQSMETDKFLSVDPKRSSKKKITVQIYKPKNKKTLKTNNSFRNRSMRYSSFAGKGARPLDSKGPMLKTMGEKAASMKYAKFSSRSKEKNKISSAFTKGLTKLQLRKKRLVERRLKKRQTIRARYSVLLAKGIFIKKAGTGILIKNSLKNRSTKTNSTVKGTNERLVKEKKTFSIKATQIKEPNLKGLVKTTKKEKLISTVNSVKKAAFLRMKKKFLKLFVSKINKTFLKHLKEIMNYWHNVGIQQSNKEAIKKKVKYAPLGYSQHWNLSRLKQLKNQPLKKLTRLIEVLEIKSLSKMEKLRKHFIAFGFLSKTQGLGYYQIITFLKNLKKIVVLQSKNLNVKGLNNNLLEKNNNKKAAWLQTTPTLLYGKKIKSVSEKVLANTLKNVQQSCRKIKFISYLKTIVQKHRSDNIFYYLCTLADASKDLKQFKKFTKTHANFLFGLDLKKITSNSVDSSLQIGSTEQSPLRSLQNNKGVLTLDKSEKIKERVRAVLIQSKNKSELEKNLQDAFLQQIEKQKKMSRQNLNLIPKISIKFYSIKSVKSLQCKASIVANSIVDALEKRKAFRKVIKDAKENLMLTDKVKGVKIQVAGRLNGAEIARTEWVRAGRVPLQTLRANIDYCSCAANTIYGIIGIKVWIFKGYSKML